FTLYHAHAGAAEREDGPRQLLRIGAFRAGGEARPHPLAAAAALFLSARAAPGILRPPAPHRPGGLRPRPPARPARFGAGAPQDRPGLLTAARARGPPQEFRPGRLRRTPSRQRDR